MDDDLRSRPPITRRELAAGLCAAGVASGSVLMLHTSVSSLGYVVGGADTIVLALLDALGEEGTLMAMTGWDHDAYHLDVWPEALREAYLRDPPVFDPAISESDREVGRLPERLRTWPGARRSDHPVASVAAIGARARWLVAGHPPHYPFGEGSPFAKLVDARGDVLVLGAPLGTLTILHHAESIAAVPGKREVTYRAAVPAGDGWRWRFMRDIETSDVGAFPYEAAVGPGADAFEVIGREALAAGIGRSSPVGEATAHLLPAAPLVAFGVAWLEGHFGGSA